MNTTKHQISDHLFHIIQQEIYKKGPISFATFMQIALYQSKYGYYQNQRPKIGSSGDFVTAPELGPIFAQCIFKQLEQIFKETSYDTILEFGAGTGQLAYDILSFCQKNKVDIAQYLIIETSSYMRYLQQQKLNDFTQVFWFDHLPRTPIYGIILANEVLDAMPVHCFSHTRIFYERCVGLKDGQLIWYEQASSSYLQKHLEVYLENLPQGYQSEINLLIKPWLKSLMGFFQEGIILLIDYGFPKQEYYHPDRSQGTLICHHQHQMIYNPFINLGLQDITAHVDFTAVVEAAQQVGFDFIGYSSLAGFCHDVGISQLIMDSHSNYQEFYLLMSPSEMGELFKCLALGKNINSDLIGFQNMSRML